MIIFINFHGQTPWDHSCQYTISTLRDKAMPSWASPSDFGFSFNSFNCFRLLVTKHIIGTKEVSFILALAMTSSSRYFWFSWKMHIDDTGLQKYVKPNSTSVQFALFLIIGFHQNQHFLCKNCKNFKSRQNISFNAQKADRKDTLSATKLL